ncbi:MAG: response regulator transcription factor [Odoribacteraceae bacterium]|jgi:DNA-binding NarL/FixJ family response regulator|nr:response regulator transcription factor [Odoribacteraceae bacterium]
MTRSFILADNQYITRVGVAALLERMSLARSIEKVTSPVELMGALSRCPDAAVVLDYTLFGFTDVQMMNVNQKYRRSLWVLFSDDLSRGFLRQVLLSGQRFSVVMKTDAEEEIAAALAAAARDEVSLCEYAERLLAEGIPPRDAPAGLTATERSVLHEIALGKTTKEIAFEQCLSFHTINTHRKNIFRKLGVNNVHDAIKYALRAGIIDAAEYYI